MNATDTLVCPDCDGEGGTCCLDADQYPEVTCRNCGDPDLPFNRILCDDCAAAEAHHWKDQD